MKAPLPTDERMVHVTNFGYAYCVQHGVDQPGFLSDKCGHQHLVTDTIPAGSVAGRCDWLGCEERFCEI